MHRRIDVIINTSELGAGTRGSSLGPGAILTAARVKKDSFFDDHPAVSIGDLNSALDQPSTTPFAHYITPFAEVFDALKEAVSSCLTEGGFPLVLSGDHSSAAGTIAGIKLADPSKRIGVIWIDAHADIHSPFTTPSGNMHGMPIAIALGLDNLSLQKNHPDTETLERWNYLKTCDTGAAKVLAEDLVYIAVRDTEEEEDQIIADKGITVHTVADVRTSGVAAVVEVVNEQLHDCDLIYVSFDVDSMDPELTSFGTGTPVGNGITPDEARELLTAFAGNPKTACIEIVEVNPCLDNKGNVMAETAFSLLTAISSPTRRTASGDADTLNS